MAQPSVLTTESGLPPGVQGASDSRFARAVRAFAGLFPTRDGPIRIPAAHSATCTTKPSRPRAGAGCTRCRISVHPTTNLASK